MTVVDETAGASYRYAPRRTLTVRTELVRQLLRRRTLVALGLAVALPLIVVAAVKLGPSSSGPGRGGSYRPGLRNGARRMPTPGISTTMSSS